MNRYIDNLSNLNLICMQAFNLYTIHKRLSVGQAQTGEYKAKQRAQKTQHQNYLQPNNLPLCVNLERVLHFLLGPVAEAGTFFFTVLNRRDIRARIVCLNLMYHWIMSLKYLISSAELSLHCLMMNKMCSKQVVV